MSMATDLNAAVCPVNLEHEEANYISRC